MNTNESAQKPAGSEPVLRMQCDEIEALLTDYMSRELGEPRALLVREHLRLCPRCQAAASAIGATLELLRRASGEMKGTPEHLSSERRRRVMRAYLHPVLEWFARHHVLVSVIVALIVMTIALVVTIRNEGDRDQEDVSGVGITIGEGHSRQNEGEAEPGTDR
jgi:predicted anti-sigma-YlaC factor YlaD